jgi:hypothetical protein
VKAIDDKCSRLQRCAAYEEVKSLNVEYSFYVNKVKDTEVTLKLARLQLEEIKAMYLRRGLLVEQLRSLQS